MKGTVNNLMLIALACPFCLIASGGSDAERNNSMEMNSAKNVASTSRTEGGVRVLFLGNSITLHGVAPQIGWMDAVPAMSFTTTQK